MTQTQPQRKTKLAPETQERIDAVGSGCSPGGPRRACVCRAPISFSLSLSPTPCSPSVHQETPLSLHLSRFSLSAFLALYLSLSLSLSLSAVSFSILVTGLSLSLSLSISLSAPPSPSLSPVPAAAGSHVLPQPYSERHPASSSPPPAQPESRGMALESLYTPAVVAKVKGLLRNAEATGERVAG